MSDRYSSRIQCQYCNCWYANNRLSRDSHERGASHQANVRKHLNETSKRQTDMVSAERDLQRELEKIEAAAMKAFEEDAKRDPFAKDEMIRVREAKGQITSSSFTRQ